MKKNARNKCDALFLSTREINFTLFNEKKDNHYKIEITK